MSWKATEAYREPSTNRIPLPTVFEPSKYSRAELLFLLQTLGQSPVVALEDVVLPEGVNEAAVRPLLQQVYSLEELRQHRGKEWAGIDAIKDAAVRYLSWMTKSEEVYHRTKRTANPIRHPSQCVLEGRKLIPGVVGADAKYAVVTELLPDGTRKPFNVDLLEPDQALMAFEASADPMGDLLKDAPRAQPTYDKLDESKDGVILCPICSFAQNYTPGSRASRGGAYARMMKHLATAKMQTERHRILKSRLASH